MNLFNIDKLGYQQIKNLHDMLCIDIGILEDGE